MGKGKLFVISGASGVGKSTVLSQVMAQREDLLFSPQEQEAMDIMRKAFNGVKAEEAVDNILNMFAHTKNNEEFVQTVKKNRFF